MIAIHEQTRQENAFEKRFPSAPYVAPFLIFLGFLALQPWLYALTGRWEAVIRVAAVTAALAVFSRPVLDFRVKRWLGTPALGVAVFLLWIAPDLIFQYRDHWLFQNPVLGTLGASFPEELRRDQLFLVFRTFRAVLLVPILEELFWRGWLMRWLIAQDFRSIPLGSWTRSSFWICAVLFAAEHGPHWEVGLLAGIAYNWWMIRTRSLGDCILAHAVTNACLSAYVLWSGKWEYWL